MIDWDEPDCLDPLYCGFSGEVCNPCAMSLRISELEDEVDNLKDIISGRAGTRPVDITRRYSDDWVEIVLEDSPKLEDSRTSPDDTGRRES